MICDVTSRHDHDSVAMKNIGSKVKSKSQKCSKRVILSLLALEHHDPKKAPAESKRQQHWPLNTVPLEKRRMVWLFLPLQQQLISCEEITTKKSRLCLPARSIKMEGAW